MIEPFFLMIEPWLAFLVFQGALIHGLKKIVLVQNIHHKGHAICSQLSLNLILKVWINIVEEIATN